MKVLLLVAIIGALGVPTALAFSGSKDLIPQFNLNDKQLFGFSTTYINIIIEEDLKNFGPEACVKIIYPRFEKITHEAYEDLMQCYDMFTERIWISGYNFMEHFDFFVHKARQIQEIGQKCVNENSIEVDQIKCILVHIPDTIVIMAEILKDADKLLYETVQETLLLYKDTRVRIRDVMYRTGKHFLSLVLEVLVCRLKQ